MELTVIVQNFNITNTLRKKDVVLTKESFVDLKKRFIHETKLKNSFVHSTKPEKGFDF